MMRMESLRTLLSKFLVSRKQISQAILLILLSIGIHTSQAQIPQVSWTAQDKETHLPHQYLKLKNGNLVTFTELNNGAHLKNLLIKVYDSRYKLIKEIDHKTWENPKWSSKKYMLNNAKVFDGKIYLIVSKVEKKQLHIYSNLLTSDYKASDELMPITNFGLAKSRTSINPISFIFGLLTFNPLLMFDVEDANNYLKYQYSDDHSKHVFYNFSQDKDAEYLEAICFDQNFKQQYISKQKLPKDRKFKNEFIDKIKVSNQGDLIFNYRMITKNGAFNKDGNIVLAKVSNQGQSIQIKKFETYNEAIEVNKLCDFSYDQSSLLAFKNIAPKKGSDKIIGFEMSEISLSNLEPKQNSFNVVDADLIRKMYPNKKAEKVIEKNKGIDDKWNRVNLYTMPDNSQIVILEEHMIKSTTYSRSNGSSTTYYSHFFGDILVLKFNDQRQLEWTKVLYRKQGYYTESTLSYLGTLTYRHGNHLYLIYNDDGKNIQYQGSSGSNSKTDVSRSKNIKKANAVMKIIGVDGTVQSKTIFVGTGNDEIMNTTDIRVLDQDHILLRAHIRKKMKFGILNFSKNSSINQQNDTASKLSNLNQENVSEEEDSLGLKVNELLKRFQKNPELIDPVQVTSNSEASDEEVDSLELKVNEVLMKLKKSNMDLEDTQENSQSVANEKLEKTEYISQIQYDSLKEAQASSPLNEEQIERLKKEIFSDNPNDYYAIELIRSKSKLSHHELFDKFKNLDVRYENKTYCYFIGNFKSIEISRKFLNYLEKHQIKGTIVHYLYGRRG